MAFVEVVSYERPEFIVEIVVDGKPLIDGKTGKVWKMDRRDAYRGLEHAKAMDREIQRICAYLQKEERDG